MHDIFTSYVYTYTQIQRNRKECNFYIELCLYESIGRQVGSYNQIIHIIEIHLFFPSSIIFQLRGPRVHRREFHKTFSLKYKTMLQTCIDCEA